MFENVCLVEKRKEKKRKIEKRDNQTKYAKNAVPEIRLNIPKKITNSKYFLTRVINFTSKHINNITK